MKRKMETTNDIEKAREDLERAEAQRAEMERSVNGYAALYQAALEGLGHEMAAGSANLEPLITQALRTLVLKEAAPYAVNYSTKRVTGLRSLLGEPEEPPAEPEEQPTTEPETPPVDPEEGGNP